MDRAGSGGHWLRRNDSTWTPPHVVFLDSETATTGSGDTEMEVLRCWAAQYVRRRDRRHPGTSVQAEGIDQWAAARTVDRWATEGKTTWLYAHNVGFDLVTTRLAQNLATYGWDLSSRFGLAGNAPWCVLHKGKRARSRDREMHDSDQGKSGDKWDHTLTITDSWSLLPVALEVIGQATGQGKLPLPAQDGSLADWLNRCSTDVAILADAVLAVMDYWDEHELGRWAVTGPACGWNAYRHTIKTGDVLISDDRAVLETEHAACYGGRRDVFRVGDMPPGQYAEIDFTAAYPTIAAHVQLPRKVMGRLTAPVYDRILDGRSQYGMLAEVTLTTSQPRWPLRAGGRVFYPVGTFRTVLAGPDIKAAYDRGALDQVHRGWFYSMSGHMQPWARHVLGLVQDSGGQVPGPVRIAAKAWSRAVIGKTAQRGWRTVPWLGPPGDDWSYEEAFIAGEPHRASVTGLAGQYWLSIADQEGSHEFPAILAWIEAEVRQRLNDVIEAAPPGAVIQCDTDGLMVSYAVVQDQADKLGWALFPLAGEMRPVEHLVSEWNKRTDPLRLREKATYRDVVVYGPQHVVLDGQPRMAGVPASAWQAGDGRWNARLWPGLSWQIQQGSTAGYTRPVQPYLITGPYAQGWVLADGAVRPVEAAVGRGGKTRLLRWPETRWAARGDVLGPVQAGWSKGLTDE